MPTTVEFFAPNLGEAFCYDLSSVVGAGQGAINEANDVRLIQTLLNVIFYTYPLPERSPPNGYSELEVTGVYQHATHLHLARFKEIMRAIGIRTPADGKVDPMDGHPNSRTKRGYWHVITIMNYFLRWHCKQHGHEDEYLLHLARNTKAGFQVDAELFNVLNNNKRWEMDNWPAGPLPQ